MINEQTLIVRETALKKYGGQCVCACGCRDANLRRLQFHHVRGGGSKERLSGIRGYKLYLKLYAEERDDQLSLLCANCHFEVTMFDKCEGSLLDPIATTVVPEHRRTPVNTETVSHDNSCKNESSTPVNGPIVISTPVVNTRVPPDPYRELLTSPAVRPVTDPLMIWPAPRKRSWTDRLCDFWLGDRS
jgi:hypothetical protein